MTQWKGAPTRVKPAPSTPNDLQALVDHLKYLTELFALLSKDLEFIINGNLDVKNIRASSITADRMDVDELSAISANLGHITAGLIEAVQIFGSYIATSTSYPKVEFSSVDNFIQASQDANRYIVVAPVLGGTPAIQIFNGVSSKSLLFLVNSDGGSVGAIGDLFLSATGGSVKLNDWDTLYSVGDGQSLQSALNNLSSSISSLSSAISSKATSGASTSSVGNHNHGIPDGTVLMVDGGGTVTFVSSGGHSHTQT